MHVVGLILSAFLLISYLVLPVQATRRAYLNIMLLVGIMLLSLGFVIPLARQPEQCFDPVTPNSQSTSLTCAFGGAFATFGGLFLDDLTVAHGREVPASIAHIAPDPLEEAFDADAVARLMRSKDVAIKRMLLDQGIVSGIGNIYADEALWRAHLHGARPTELLTRPKARSLLAHVRDVLEESLQQGGTSFDALYVSTEGVSGLFERSLNAYGREDRPCPRCA